MSSFIILRSDYGQTYRLNENKFVGGQIHIVSTTKNHSGVSRVIAEIDEIAASDDGSTVEIRCSWMAYEKNGHYSLIHGENSTSVTMQIKEFDERRETLAIVSEDVNGEGDAIHQHCTFFERSREEILSRDLIEGIVRV